MGRVIRHKNDWGAVLTFLNRLFYAMKDIYLLKINNNLVPGFKMKFKFRINFNPVLRN